jgi:thiamine biosynthesis lipoprotein
MRFLQVLLAIILAAGINSCKKAEPVHITGEAQGTYYSILYFDSLNRDFHPEIDSILKRFDQSVSLWVPGSVLSRVNRNDTTVVLDGFFTGNFNLSQKISEKTDGAFDITVSPLVEVWGFGYESRKHVDKHIVDSLLPLINYKNIKIVKGKVVKSDPRMKIDFNAIAQGYSVDVIGNFLETKGIKNYLIDIGGEVKAKGEKAGGKPWKIGIEKPAADKNASRSLKAVITLKNKSIATSGSYRKYFEENGVRYSHTIDPKTGYPVRHSLLSVSVIAGNTAVADAYATAFMVMGYKKALDFVRNDTSLEAFFIWSDTVTGNYKTYATKGFENRIVKIYGK